MVVPKEYRREVLRGHGAPTAGHAGIYKTLFRANQLMSGNVKESGGERSSKRRVRVFAGLPGCLPEKNVSELCFPFWRVSENSSKDRAEREGARCPVLDRRPPAADSPWSGGRVLHRTAEPTPDNSEPHVGREEHPTPPIIKLRPTS
ncbi:hypothetical protein CBL_20549 [Carabus blaptoides fortunei]